MSFDTVSDNTPVLVGCAAISQPGDDPAQMDEALLLMEKAVRMAAVDAGAVDLLQQIDYIGAPQGFWQYGDPGRYITRAVGSPQAFTCVAAIGVSQQALINDACQRIADGASVAVITGGEAKYRSLLASIQQKPQADTIDETVPDRLWRSEDVLWSALEEQRGLVMPVEFYALIESAMATAKGYSPAQQRQYLGELYAGFSQVACGNDTAWFREPFNAEAISAPSDRNPLLAFPYTKRLNSQWNVNQAGALVFCSAGKARELGIAPEKWVFPRVLAESNYMRPLSERPHLHRHEGMQQCARAVFESSGLTAGQVDLVDIYSCFPSAVQSHAMDIGLPASLPLTVTGGMAFYGGPLNNFVIQSTVAMAHRLRQAPGSNGLVSCISGINNKQGLALYSSKKPVMPFVCHDVSGKTRTAMQKLTSIAEYSGRARLLASTVVYHKGEASHAFAIAETAESCRLVCRSNDASVMAELQQHDCNGQLLEVTEAGDFRLIA